MEIIVGTDQDMEDSIRKTFDFINKKKVLIQCFYILTSIPGTDLYKQYKEEGSLLTENWKDFDGSQCLHISKNYVQKVN